MELPDLEPVHMQFNPSHTNDTTPHTTWVKPGTTKATSWEAEQVSRGPLGSASGSGQGEQLLGF